jgi:hypothetical protein
VKRSRKAAAVSKIGPTPDQIRQHIQCMADEHQFAWQAELMTSSPHWVYLLGLHLRMVELDHLEDAVEQLL